MSAGLVFIGALTLLWIRPPGISKQLVWLGLALQGIICLSTAAWWAPLMARLVRPEAGMSFEDYRLLMSTQWVRLALITAYGVTSFYMLIRSAVTSLWSVS